MEAAWSSVPEIRGCRLTLLTVGLARTPVLLLLLLIEKRGTYAHRDPDPGYGTFFLNPFRNFDETMLNNEQKYEI